MREQLKSYLVEFFDEGKSKPQFEYVIAISIEEAKLSLIHI